VENSAKVPVLMIVFNRPDTTKVVLDRIREYKPTHLYITADGPRNGNENDLKKTAEVRALFENLDWPCEVITNYKTVNQGCKMAVSSGITWFFDQVESGIILEDDCLVDYSFFLMCEELLEKYKGDEEVMSIGASNFQYPSSQTPETTYYFSRYNHIWGWASWKRAWKNYKLTPQQLPKEQLLDSIKQLFQSKAERTYWLAIYDYVMSGKLDTWDFQWQFSMWAKGGIAITPQVNMVTNLGFGPDATHGNDPNSWMAKLIALPIKFPIVHPSDKSLNNEADRVTSDRLFNIYKSYRTNHFKIKLATWLPSNAKKELKKLMLKFKPA
jgi:hypothetical protein